MRDQEIRVELERRLQGRYGADPNTRVVHEMGILTGEYRIDVAVINGHLEGFEIKSERDSLERLPRQAAAYGRVFDRLTVICAERHLERALEILPEWWGVEVAEHGDQGLRIVRRRAARANRGREPHAIAQLLWRSEALAALEGIGAAKGVRSKPKRVLWTRLAEGIPAHELRALVRENLRARRSWLTAG